MRPWTPWLDRAGAFVSAFCAVHCAGLGLVFVLAPGLWLQGKGGAFGSEWLHRLEWLLAASALLLATLALAQGWRRHRRCLPAALAAPGLGLMAIGIFTELHSLPLLGSAVVLGGGLLLVLAHGFNLHLARKSVASH